MNAKGSELDVEVTVLDLVAVVAGITVQALSKDEQDQIWMQAFLLHCNAHCGKESAQQDILAGRDAMEQGLDRLRARIDSKLGRTRREDA